METLSAIIDSMAAPKKIQKVSDVIDRIIELRKQRDAIIKELDELEGAPLQKVSPLPSDFDLKPAIMQLFSRPEVVLNIDSIIAGIHSKNGFVPDRATVSLRVGYLADTAKKIERVPGKRGYYRLPTSHTINITDKTAIDG